MQLLDDMSTRVTGHDDDSPPSASSSCGGWRWLSLPSLVDGNSSKSATNNEQIWRCSSLTTAPDLVKSTTVELGGSRFERVGLGYFRGLAAGLNGLVSLTAMQLLHDIGEKKLGWRRGRTDGFAGDKSMAAWWACSKACSSISPSGPFMWLWAF
nr:hypothetical protein Itr_chr11CG03230 [Ipomoea trifida]